MENKVIKLKNTEKDNVVSSSDLITYYKKFYPSAYIINWLTRSNTKTLNFREFCFTSQENVYIRHQTFKNLAEFQKRIASLNPIKIDIGGIYNKEPNSSFLTSLVCVEKELIFDIDISDYDSVRKCCQQKSICSKCWKYLVCGAKMLQHILSENFGFEQIFFVFSGRRGIHCWVCDQRACELSKEARLAIEQYITYEPSNSSKKKKNFFEPIYPGYLQLVSLVKNDFFTIIKEQDLLKYLDIQKILKKYITIYCPVIDMDYINEILEKNIDSLSKMEKIYMFLKEGEKVLRGVNVTYYTADGCLNEFIMTILSPRLDINVTIQIGHLLKGPFCVHPQTGYISVPMPLQLLEKMNFNCVPKIENLISNEDNKDKIIFYDYIKFFKLFIENLKKK